VTDCDLCSLATPDPPVTDAEVPGEFCCRGCLEVARVLGEGDGEEAERVRGRLDGEAGATAGGGAEGNADEDPPAEAFLHVKGMHCAACEAFVESRAVAAEGVTLAEANYPTDTIRVGYDPERVAESDLDGLVDAGGYRATPMDASESDEGRTDAEDDRVGRLLVGGFFGMQAMVWYLLFLYPSYAGLPESWLLFDLGGTAGGYLLANVWVAATVVLGYTGAPLVRGAWVSLRARRPNMDLLVALAATTAYAYSTLALLLGRAELYFDVTVVIVVVVTVGGYYEDRIRRRAAGELADRTRETVREARRLPAETDPAGMGEDLGADAVAAAESVDFDAVAAGDTLLVTAGERVPLDGTVVAGSAAVDASLLTGESLPERRTVGDEVAGGAVLTDGHLAVAVGDDRESTTERVRRLLWAARTGRPGVQRLADRLAAVFVPAVVVLAALTAGAHLLLGASPTGALLTGLAVLVVSCPCALGLATPLATASGVRAALARGVVYTGSEAFEVAEDAAVVAFDKTGTLTTGDLRVLAEDAAGATGCDAARVGPRAAAVEALADHPVATAVTDRFDPPAADVSGFRTHPGYGVEARVGDERVVVGRPALFEGAELGPDWEVPARHERAARAAREAGRIPVLVGWEGAVRGVLVAGDEPRPGWRETVSAVAERVEEVVVLTGDDDAAARPFEAHPDVDEVFAGLPPAGKARAVERLRERGPTVMVGDGSNDAPALAAADLGVALASGTDLAADAADAVVLDGDPRVVPTVFDLTRATRRRVRENLVWAFCYNAVALPLAATGLLSPLLAAVAMGASSLLVVANSARPLLGETAPDTGPGADRERATTAATGASDPGAVADGGAAER
jgi:Cu2+-exporting ATPase